VKVSIKTAWLMLVLGGLYGCAPITPLPTMSPPPVPAPQPPGMPSSGLPSSGPPSIPGGQPSQPSGGQPSDSQSGSPGAPSSGGGGDPSSYDQLPSGGLGGEGGNDQPGGEPGSVGETEGETEGETAGESSGESDAESGSPGSEGEQSWEDIAGTGDGESDSEGGDGWEVSNELPGSGSDSAGDADSESDGNGNGNGNGKNGTGDDQFQGALEEFDGEILAELEIAKSGGGQSNIPTPGDATAGATQEDNTIRALPRSNEREMPSPPPPRRSGERLPDDIPDAKDDDIIARQLREAAMVEIDPELKEKLWEEYRKYKKG
jgi:hypothetical protein